MFAYLFYCSNKLISGKQLGSNWAEFLNPNTNEDRALRVQPWLSALVGSSNGPVNTVANCHHSKF